MSRPSKALCVRFVDGERIRRQHVYFTMGCHSRKCRYIPAGQIWIEKSMSSDDREATILHELVEYEAMNRGMSYNRAHNLANKAERALRRCL